MEVAETGDMGPERILPNSEDDLGQERPSDGAIVGGGGGAGEWSGEDIDEEEEGGGGGGEEEEEEEEGNDGYYYQPLNQDPEGVSGLEPGDAGQLQEVQERIEAMGMHLPPPPDEEAEPEGEPAERCHASIPMDDDHVELVKRTMATIVLPNLGVPPWAREISEDQWTDMVQHTLQTHQSSSALLMPQGGDLD